MKRDRIWWLLALMLALGSSPSACWNAEPQRPLLAIQVAYLVVPYPEDPPFRAMVIDLLNQGLFSSAQGSGAGFIPSTETNITSVNEADCELSAKSGFTLYQLLHAHSHGHGSFSLKPKLLRPSSTCSTQSPYSFPSTHYGIAALGPQSSALPRQISASTGLPPTFAYCLPNINLAKQGNGSLFFGAATAQSYPFKVPLLRIPMSITADHYSLQLTGVEMLGSTAANASMAKNKKKNKVPLLLSNGGLSVTVSSTSDFLYFPTHVYNYIHSEIIKSVTDRGIPEHKFDQLILYPTSGCYDFKNADILASPKIKLTFSGKYDVVLDASSYFILTQGTVSCLRIYEQDSATLGITAQQGRLVEFDLGKKTLGISEPLSKFNIACSLKFPSK